MASKGQQRLLCRQEDLSSDPQRTHNHVAACSGFGKTLSHRTRQTAMEQGISSSLGEHEHEEAHRHVHMYMCAHARTEIFPLDL